MSTTNHPTTDLDDHRGRKYLTADERKRLLSAVRAHPKPSDQTLALVDRVRAAQASPCGPSAAKAPGATSPRSCATPASTDPRRAPEASGTRSVSPPSPLACRSRRSPRCSGTRISRPPRSVRRRASSSPGCGAETKPNDPDPARPAPGYPPARGETGGRLRTWGEMTFRGQGTPVNVVAGAERAPKRGRRESVRATDRRTPYANDGALHRAAEQTRR